MNNTQWSIVKRVRNLFSTKLFITVYLFLSVGFANAQFEQHLTWKSEVEKISETEFKVKFICTLKTNGIPILSLPKKADHCQPNSVLKKIKT
jgi:hypothetical protein